MRTLADRFHCPRCKGRLDTITAEALTGTPAGSLFCTLCEAIVPAPDGIPDFVGDRVVPDTHPQGLGGDPYLPDQDAARLWDLITVAAGTRWPASLGDVLELGCGAGRLTRPLALASAARSVVAVDSAMDSLRACRERISQDAQPGTAGVSLVRLSLAEE